jgi:DNA-binding NarL/FixJ family response regulator
MRSSEEILQPPGILAKICPLLTEGYDDCEIARLLDVDEAAVQDYVSQLVQAFNVNSRLELLFYFLRVAKQERA